MSGTKLHNYIDKREMSVLLSRAKKRNVGGGLHYSSESNRYSVLVRKVVRPLHRCIALKYVVAVKTGVRVIR